MASASRNVLGILSKDIPIDTIITESFASDTLFHPMYQVLTAEDVSLLQNIHDNYSLPLSKQQYETISTDIEALSNILAKIKSFQIWNTGEESIQLIMNIVEDALMGSLNMAALYMNNVYDEYKITLLQSKENDILSKKNQMASMESSEGQFMIQQSVFLTPLYNNYIYLYGLPKFGVGFDPDKLVFVEKLLRLLVQNDPSLQQTFFPYEVVAPVDPPTDTMDPSWNVFADIFDASLNVCADICDASFNEFSCDQSFNVHDTMNPYPYHMVHDVSWNIDCSNQTVDANGLFNVNATTVQPTAWENLVDEAVNQIVKKRKKRIDIRLLSPTTKQFYEDMTKR